MAAPYDYEQPQAGQIFAVPESPPLMMPDDWDQRVQTAGALLFRVPTERTATLANLKAALETLPADEHGATAKLLALPPEEVAPFFGIGLGYLLGATLQRRRCRTRDICWMLRAGLLAERPAGHCHPR